MGRDTVSYRYLIGRYKELVLTAAPVHGTPERTLDIVREGLTDKEVMGREVVNLHTLKCDLETWWAIPLLTVPPLQPFAEREFCSFAEFCPVWAGEKMVALLLRR